MITQKSKRQKKTHSLKVQYETLSNKEFGEVYANDFKIVKRAFVFFALKYNGDFKVGFVASKKIGKAHMRNKAKRRLREVVRLNQNIIPKNYKIVLVSKKRVLDMDFDLLQQEFYSCLNSLQ